MKRTNVRTIVVVTVMSLLLVTHPISAQSQHRASSWLITDLKSSLVQEVRGSMAAFERTLRAKTGTILVEVRGDFRSTKGALASVDVPAIKLVGMSLQSSKRTEWEFAPIGLGSARSDGTCDCVFPDSLVKGAMSTSTTRSKFGLSREKEGAAAVLTIEENPTEMCFAFAVPEGIKGGVKLYFGDTEVSVPVPQQ